MIKKVMFYITIFILIIINILIYLNITNYIDILNLCFNQDILLNKNEYSLICFLIAFISILFIIDILLVVFKKNGKKDDLKFIQNGTYGTANWMNEDEMKQVLGVNTTPGIILGKFNQSIVKLPFDSHFNKNIAVFGSSGSMKTIRLCFN